MLAAKQQMQGGQPGQAPQEAPADPGMGGGAPDASQGGPVITQNPFMHLINGMGPAGMGQGQDASQGQAPAQADPTKTKFLISAMQNLHSYIAANQDPTEVAIARSIIQLVTKLIARDQQTQQGAVPAQPEQPQAGMPAQPSQPGQPQPQSPVAGQ